MSDKRDWKPSLLLFPPLNPTDSSEKLAELESQVPRLTSLVRNIEGRVLSLVEWWDYKGHLSKSFRYFTMYARAYYHDIVNWKEWNIWEENFIKYINWLFQILEVRRVYNTSPRVDFSEFRKYKSWDKFASLIVPKWHDLPFMDYTTWWSCHNYSMMFREFFQTLWVETSIIFCNPVSNHSFLLVKMFWKHYLVDPLFNRRDFMREINIWDKIQIWFSYFWRIKSFSPVFSVDYFHESSEDDISHSTLRTIDSSEAFANELDNRDIKYIIIENYINESKVPFRLEIWKESWNNFFVSIWLWNIELEYNLNFRKVANLYRWLDINSLTNNEIIKILVESVYKTKWNKQWISLDNILKYILNCSDTIKRRDLLMLLNLDK